MTTTLGLSTATNNQIVAENVGSISVDLILTTDEVGGIPSLIMATLTLQERVSGSGTLASDISPTSVTITIPAGASSSTLTTNAISIVDDIIEEGDEAFRYFLTSFIPHPGIPNFSLLETTLDITVTDDDSDTRIVLEIIESTTLPTLLASTVAPSGQAIVLSDVVTMSASALDPVKQAAVTLAALSATASVQSLQSPLAPVSEAVGRKNLDSLGYGSGIDGL